jgi:hypothetical protein
METSAVASINGLPRRPGLAFAAVGERSAFRSLRGVLGVASFAKDAVVNAGKTLGGRARNASAYHSYHTCRLFVRRHMLTRSSLLLGRYNGSCVYPINFVDCENVNACWYLKWEEQGEPRQHILRRAILAIRVNA